MRAPSAQVELLYNMEALSASEQAVITGNLRGRESERGGEGAGWRMSHTS